MKPRDTRPGPRPDLWCTGPDPQRHAQYVAWIRSRAQARHRQEPWQLPFTDYETVWRDRWSQRGRGTWDLCMTRRDPQQPWQLDNVMLITRAEHNQRSQRARQRPQQDHRP